MFNKNSTLHIVERVNLKNMQLKLQLVIIGKIYSKLSRSYLSKDLKLLGTDNTCMGLKPYNVYMENITHA